MDGRDAMGLPGSGSASGSYFMQRGMQGSGSGGLSGLHGSPGFLRPMSNLNVPIQSNFGVSSGGESVSYQVESSSGISSPQGGVGGSAVPYGGGEQPVKKKRGRPRKYGPDGTVSLGLSTSVAATSPSSQLVSVTPSNVHKRGRGRPPGSGRKQQLASLGVRSVGDILNLSKLKLDSRGYGFNISGKIVKAVEDRKSVGGVNVAYLYNISATFACEWVSGSAGMGFTPHIITIEIGEDIQTKIMSFSQQGPRAICILSASGAVSTVTLNQPSTSGGTVTYEGLFEILCLSGSYMVTDNDGSRNRTGGLTVSLSSPDGRVIGGGVGGMLIAASPVQVIVGSFVYSGASRTKNKEGGAGPESGANVSDFPGDRSAANTTSSSPLNQNLTPSSTMSSWPSSRPMDMRSATHIDINLARG
ncbi:hypothetical protein GIB67_022843 [Kingdonia uniflora]|uniref:AT-hook motif nuclear-localized protein n=1 Tax=Kingdonia uniflora TaxID=39325 RepID=A0A7J7P7A8_9MAGN|nr:hypothetical protein GIB67_022843 [Kingdonia uniflora]